MGKSPSIKSTSYTNILREQDYFPFLTTNENFEESSSSSDEIESFLS